ncbi:MAG: VOC family protein [Polyangiaceae bacterium]
MFTPKPRIELHVEDADRSAAFYAALLQTDADRSQGAAAVFDLESPPLTLTLTPRTKGGPSRSLARFALVVLKPEDIGHTAIALRRAKVRLRLEDAGIVTQDPDGNDWRVRFVPSAREPAVLTVAEGA